MAAMKLALIRAELGYRARLLGWPCLSGGLLLLASLVVFVILLVPMHAQLQQRESDLTLLRAVARPAETPAQDNTPQRTLQVFYRQLPADSQAPGLFQQILAMANEQGIEPEKSEYQLTRNPSAAFTCYQMILPLHGRYLDIRKFVITVLNTLPTVALSEINVHRDDANPEQVEARLRFSVYVGRATR